jgi:exodeoxyribonuclease-3
MKVITWNVNGIRAREAQLLELVATQAPDVLCLQEVKAAPEQIPASLLELPGYHCYWHGQKGYSGVGLLFRKERFAERPSYFHPAFDHECRIVCGRVGQRVFASIYVPNGGKEFEPKIRFLEALEAFTAESHARGEELVLCGDYNVAREPRDVHPQLRKETEIGQTPGERALFEKILARGLVDLGRLFAPDDDRLFTWWAPWRNLRQKNVGWRLDYVLATQSVAGAAKTCTAARDVGTSDHGPVTAVFDA